MERENLHYSIEKKRSWLLYDVHANKKLFTSNYTLLHTTCKFGLTYLFLSPITTEIFRWLLLVTSPYICMYLAVSTFFTGILTLEERTYIKSKDLQKCTFYDPLKDFHVQWHFCHTRWIEASFTQWRSSHPFQTMFPLGEMYLAAWRTGANISFMQNRFNVLSREFQWRRRNDISAVSTFARRESKQIRTERVMSVAFIFVPLSISGTHATTYLIFPFCTAPGQLVCICHFRDSLANLTREIDSYWSPAKLMVIWSCLCLIVPTQHRLFFNQTVGSWILAAFDRFMAEIFGEEQVGFLV